MSYPWLWALLTLMSSLHERSFCATTNTDIKRIFEQLGGNNIDPRVLEYLPSRSDELAEKLKVIANDLLKQAPQLDFKEFGLDLDTLSNLPQPSLPNLQKALDQIPPSVLSEFAQPLSRLVSPSEAFDARHVTNVIQAVPSIARNVPNKQAVDFNKINPALIEHLLKGKALPGIAPEAVDQYLRLYMRRMVETASQALTGDQQAARLMPMLENMPTALLDRTLAGAELPGLNSTEVAVLKDYFLSNTAKNAASGRKGASAPLALNMTPAEMLQRLPPNFDTKRVPRAFVEQAARGGPVDLMLLPRDMIEQFISYNPDLGPEIRAALKNAEEKFTTTTMTPMPTYTPYDISSVDRHADLTQNAHHQSTPQSKIWMYTCIGLGVIAVIAFLIVFCLAVRYRRRQAAKEAAQLQFSDDPQYSDQALSYSFPSQAMSADPTPKPNAQTTEARKARMRTAGAWRVLPLSPLPQPHELCASSTPKVALAEGTNNNNNNDSMRVSHESSPWVQQVRAPAIYLGDRHAAQSPVPR